MAKKGGDNTKRVTLYLDREVAKNLKIESIKKEISPSDLVESTLRNKFKK